MCFKRVGKKNSSTQTKQKNKYKAATNKKGIIKSNEGASLMILFKKAIDAKKSKWINNSRKNVDLIGVVGFNKLKERYSIKGSKEKILKSMIHDYRKGRFSMTNIHRSKYDMSKFDKEHLYNMLKDYEKRKVEREKYADLNAKELKKKFILEKSKEKVLDKVVSDYKKGKLSATALSYMQGLDAKKLDQEKLNKMLETYASSPSSVARKFSVKGSKAIILQMFMDDYEKGKTSATKLVGPGGFDPNKLDKKKLNDILNKYEAKEDAKSFPKSKYENLMEDFKSLKNYQSLIDVAKKRLSKIKV